MRPFLLSSLCYRDSDHGFKSPSHGPVSLGASEALPQQAQLEVGIDCIGQSRHSGRDSHCTRIQRRAAALSRTLRSSCCRQGSLTAELQVRPAARRRGPARLRALVRVRAVPASHSRRVDGGRERPGLLSARVGTGFSGPKMKREN